MIYMIYKLFYSQFWVPFWFLCWYRYDACERASQPTAFLGRMPLPWISQNIGSPSLGLNSGIPLQRCKYVRFKIPNDGSFVAIRNPRRLTWVRTSVIKPELLVKTNLAMYNYHTKVDTITDMQPRYMKATSSLGLAYFHLGHIIA